MKIPSFKELTFENLIVGYQKDKPLLNLNSVEDGVAIKPGINLLIAPNGYGKSTFCQTLSGSLAPLSGAFRYDGKSFHPENRVLYVSEYLTFPKYIHPAEWIDFICAGGTDAPPLTRESIDRALAEFQLAHKSSSYLGSMSQGERRRVTWIAADFSQRPILLMDEPFDGLDIIASETARQILAKWKKEGRCVVIISHKFWELFDLYDEAYLIRDRKFVTWQTLFGFDPKDRPWEEIRKSILDVYR